MFPLMVDLSHVPVLLAGNGEAAVRRLALLEAGGAGELSVFAPAPSAALVAAAGQRLRRELPGPGDLGKARIAFIADLPKDESERLAAAARAAGLLVNAEDDVPASTFHVPAMVRRGRLLVTVSTGGASPGLARILRRRLEALFAGEWAGRVETVAGWRKAWRAEGLAGAEITQRTEAALAEKGWLQ